MIAAYINTKNLWRALPFCHGCIVAPLPPQPTRWKCAQAVPNELQTIGDHLKARRIQSHLFQSDVAKQIGVHFASVQNWERNLGTPLPYQIPAIIRFLRYVPFKHDGSWKGKLRWLRFAAGWTQEDWGKAAGISPGTIGRWEEGRGLQGSPVIVAALETLSNRLAAMGLGGLVGSELALLQATDFRRQRKVDRA
jgi:DNA-binding XRE family transcriptional regulator